MKEGKIDIQGSLWIKRPDKWIKCDCRFCGFHLWEWWKIFKPGSTVNRPCNHDCSLFGDPNYSKDNPSATLRLCQNQTLVFDKFTDEREKK